MMIGNNIKAARKKIGFTQEELAFQIGVTAQAVSRWESGAGLPDITMVVPLAQALSVTTDALFGLEERGQDEDMYVELREKLEAEMERHYAYYQKVLADDVQRAKYGERVLRNMEAYTPEFIAQNKERLLGFLQHTHGEEKFTKLQQAIAK